MKPRLVQCYRLAVLAGLLWLVHAQHEWINAQRAGTAIDLEAVREFLPEAEALGAVVPGHGERNVYDAQNVRIGFAVQTSPQGDAVVGYSGPTDVLLVFGAKGRVAGLRVLGSGDTPEHVAMVRGDEFFFEDYLGLGWEEVAALGEKAELDGVSGATLTSLAIREAIALRTAGRRPNLRFPEAIVLEEARELFPEVVSLVPDPERADTLRALDAEGATLGLLLKTGYLADEIQGYQGPSDALVGLNAEGDRIAGLRLRRSYDNADYVRDVEVDRRFFKKFEGRRVEEFAGSASFEEMEIEGVSGATMTSYAMVEGVFEALRDFESERARIRGGRARLAGRDWGLLAVIAMSLVVAFTRVRRITWLRRLYQVGLVGWVGFWSGDMVAQALLMGWAQSGVALTTAPGLVALVAAAFVLPVATGRQVYCHHLCPHGAAQQLLMRVVPARLRVAVPRRIALALERRLPPALLGLVVAAGMTGWGLNLAGIEPFDAYIFRTAGWASLAIFGVSLLVSAFVPMAYCRFGCPTGRLLEFVRFRRGGEHFGAREMWGGVFLVGAFVLYLGRGLAFG